MNVSTSTIEQPRRKPNQNIIDAEDASVLNLGREFDVNQINHDGSVSTLVSLNLSETRLLINMTLNQRRKEEMGRDYDGNTKDNDEEEDFSKSNEYVYYLRKIKYIFIYLRIFFFLKIPYQKACTDSK